MCSVWGVICIFFTASRTSVGLAPYVAQSAGRTSVHFSSICCFTVLARPRCPFHAPSKSDNNCSSSFLWALYSLQMIITSPQYIASVFTLFCVIPSCFFISWSPWTWGSWWTSLVFSKKKRFRGVWEIFITLIVHEFWNTMRRCGNLLMLQERKHDAFFGSGTITINSSFRSSSIMPGAVVHP